jgi:hypothetical protein
LSANTSIAQSIPDANVRERERLENVWNEAHEHGDADTLEKSWPDDMEFAAPKIYRQRPAGPASLAEKFNRQLWPRRNAVLGCLLAEFARIFKDSTLGARPDAVEDFPTPSERVRYCGGAGFST